ncbi:MAG: hypothetical protein HYY18_01015 [Planctomycetes bacterium]|nr:hypothetical protein [Planctomycetota bacterium]
MKALAATVFATITVTCGFPAGAEEAKAKLGLSAEAGTRGKNFVFTVRGKAELPDDDKVAIAVYYVRKYKIPPALVEPGGPEYDEELIEVDQGFAGVTEGAFEGHLAYSDLPPWSGLYRVTANAGGVEDSIDLVLGKAGDQAAERARADRDIYEELARIGRIYDGYKAEWDARGEAPSATWADWRAEADRRIGAIRERNAKRRKAEIYWMESRGKQRIDWLVNRLKPLLDTASQHLAKPAPQRPEPKDLLEQMSDFEQDYVYYLDFLGIGRIIDPVKVGAALARLQKSAGEVGAWRKRLPAEADAWRAAQGKLRAGLMAGQMELSGQLPEAYFGRAERVSKSLLRMLEGAQAADADWEKLEREFTEAVNALDASIPRVDD